MKMEASSRLRIAVLVPSAVALILTSVAFSQSFRQSFRASSPFNKLEVTSFLGSIKVTAGDKKWITVKSDDDDDKDPVIKATQGEAGLVKVEVSGSKPAKLEISVPFDASIDLTCYNCEITVKNARGPIRAVNTKGMIKLSSIRSSRVEARSGNGSISFNGEFIPSGNYTFRSISGRIDAEIPSDSDVRLSATCFRGGIGLGEFNWDFERQSDQVVKAKRGKGLATLDLWTQEGTIQLHKRK